ncbi:hypothetical protein J132_05410 [Termitomyces sp. J132]|nr:hypothetical protein J132_05410 [Termitomyces sp. J132]
MVEQCFSAKKKGKGKAKEPEPSFAVDEQIAHLLQQLHEARAPEDIGADVLNNPRDEAHADIFLSALEKGKWIATLPNLPEAKKACTEPSVFVKGFLTQRAPLVPYNGRVPAGDDQRMDKCSDFKVASSLAGPSKLVVAKAKAAKTSSNQGGNVKALHKESWHQAGCCNANVFQGAEAGVIIKVLKSRTYVMPGVLPQEYRPPVHQDPCDKEFYIAQLAAAQATAGAPAAPDSGSKDEEDDDVPTSK